MRTDSHVDTLTAAGAIDATYRVRAVRPGSFTRATSYERKRDQRQGRQRVGGAHRGTADDSGRGDRSDDLEFAERTDSPTSADDRRTRSYGASTPRSSTTRALRRKSNAPTPALAPEVWDQVVATTLEELELHHGRLARRLGHDPIIVGWSGPAVSREAPGLSPPARCLRVAMDSSRRRALARAAEDPAGLALLKPNADGSPSSPDAPCTPWVRRRCSSAADRDRGIGAVLPASERTVRARRHRRRDHPRARDRSATGQHCRCGGCLPPRAAAVGSARGRWMIRRHSGPPQPLRRPGELMPSLRNRRSCPTSAASAGGDPHGQPGPRTAPASLR